MWRGRMGVLVLKAGEVGSELGPEALLASAKAVATGIRVSRRHPAGTQPCLLVSESTIPVPAGSRCTTHHPRARDMITNVSPLFIVDQIGGRHSKRRHVHNDIKFILLLRHVRVYRNSI